MSIDWRTKDSDAYLCVLSVTTRRPRWLGDTVTQATVSDVLEAIRTNKDLREAVRKLLSPAGGVR